jgi:hypothetical protein
MKKASVLGVSIFAVLLLLLTTAGNAFSGSPSPRGYHQMAYDSESGLVILFGGQTGDWRDPSSWNHETWSFNPRSEKWKEMSPETSPGGYGGGDMAYDSKADRIILSVLADELPTLETWAYDTNSDTWTRLADGPRDMVGQRIVYDSESDRIIMFGGFDMTKYQFVDETWAYDYNTDTWTNMRPSGNPHGRNYHGMAYDPKTDRIVVWGGDIQGPAKKELVWTYDYNTNAWQKLRYENGPTNRDYIDLVYDHNTDKFIVYGGFSYGNDETWVYDMNTNTWQIKKPEDNPGVISRYAMVYAEDTNEIILFGGQDGATNYQYVGDTWSYNLNNNEWTLISPKP